MRKSTSINIERGINLKRNKKMKYLPKYLVYFYVIQVSVLFLLWFTYSTRRAR